ncbi:MAG: alpha/beta hydrolase-fold protein [Lachnospiraceae bacterium]|nr:alpha/beta hydrolase-fold protein [Lachnospiraceae bacterium]
MIFIEDITIEILTKERPRRLYVYVPDEINEHPEYTYPVLYMFDGHNLFFDDHATYGKSWGLKDFLDNNHIPIIVVAVECNHRGHGRLDEYSPYRARSGYGEAKGCGSIYMDWLVTELKPLIDAHFPTIPDRLHTYIAGSSMGGLMSLYAATEYSDVFSKAACLSPSVWFGYKKMLTMIRNAGIRPQTSVYMDIGSEELKGRPIMLYRMLDVEKELKKKEVPVRFRIIEDGTHTEASWEQQLPVVFSYLLDESNDRH